MQKWEYGLAYYSDGVIEAHATYMNDIDGGPQSIAHFLQEAGEKGWELCALLPDKINNKQSDCLVFKRPGETSE